MKYVKILSAVLGMALVLGMTVTADAKGAKAAGEKHAGVRGKITALGNNQFTISTGGKKNGTTVTVTVGTATTFQVDGKKDGAFGDLKVGDRVIVEPDATNPSRVIDKGQGHEKKNKAAK